MSKAEGMCAVERGAPTQGELVAMLKQAAGQNASDLHITVGLPPMVRVAGSLKRLDPGMPAMTPADTLRLAGELLSEEQKRAFELNGEVDLSKSIPGAGRFRANVYRQRKSVAMAFRLIPVEIPTPEQLGLPSVVSDLARKPSGLVLVTGPTGSGKSTTQAAMIGQMNRERSLHIITLEDPIEYLHRHQKSIINQREVGDDTRSFATGLRAALRENPDVILVGEMRDLETMQVTLNAAETGHLILATLHTSSAPQTVDRIIDAFPPFQQAQVRIQLAASLEGVIAQRLLPRLDGTGLVPAFEILVANQAVRNLIREGKSHQLQSVLQTGGREGMITMEASLRGLLEQGRISRLTYEMFSTESRFLRLLE